jgi:hypothetical protein
MPQALQESTSNLTMTASFSLFSNPLFTNNHCWHCLTWAKELIIFWYSSRNFITMFQYLSYLLAKTHSLHTYIPLHTKITLKYAVLYEHFEIVTVTTSCLHRQSSSVFSIPHRNLNWQQILLYSVYPLLMDKEKNNYQFLTTGIQSWYQHWMDMDKI